MPRFGPRGLEFARTRVEMKAAETVLHLLRERRARMKTMIPSHIWALVAPYGLTPQPGETLAPQDARTPDEIAPDETAPAKGNRTAPGGVSPPM